MPNFTIPENIRTHIKNNALKLARRPLNVALAGFPLTTAQVQYHCVKLTHEQVDTLRRLDAEGVRTIEHHTQIRLALINQNVPELRRAVVVMLQLPEWVVVGRGTQWGVSTTEFKPDDNNYLVPDLSGLDRDTYQELVTWTDRALRQVRLYEITEHCVTELLQRAYCKTSSHLHALWPTLTTLVDAKEPAWQNRFRNPTRSLKAYKPDADVQDKYGKLIMAADTMLAAGMMMEDHVYKPGVIRATIEHWERLAGDPTFPLQ